MIGMKPYLRVCEVCAERPRDGGLGVHEVRGGRGLEGTAGHGKKRSLALVALPRNLKVVPYGAELPEDGKGGEHELAQESRF